MSDERAPVLVTGALGNVGRHTVRALLGRRRRVVATDLRTTVNEALARTLPDGVDLRWADLTDAALVAALVEDVAPLAAGWEDRVGLHQLHPLLVHACLFGGGYGARAAEVAQRFG